METTIQYKLEFKHINKNFPGVKALDDVSFNVKRGTVHTICGENGAGKSTIMKILNGSISCNSGEIWIDGEKARISSPKDAAKYGIAMIWQELQYVPYLTVKENLLLNRLPTKNGLVDWKSVTKHAVDLLKNEEVNIDPDSYLYDLSISDIQLLEIMKATSADSQIIIMDEPTSSLTQYEATRLLNKIVELKKEGRTILYISHKMDEIFKISDYITIMRDGKHIVTGEASEFTTEKIIALMVGREIKDVYPKRNVDLGETILEVDSLSKDKLFHDITFDVRRGEIVGFAGLVGAGRTEIMRSIFGMDNYDSGKIVLHGKEIKIKSVDDAIKNGIMMATEDRRLYGLINVRSIKENISLSSLNRLCKVFIPKKKEAQECKTYFDRMNVRAPNMETPAYALSGGNQQKVVLAKWMMAQPEILIMDEPTRGIDVGAKHDIYELMNEIVATGRAIIMVSSELPELIGMCDRIYVVHEGKITGVVGKSDFSQELVMSYATGGR